MSRGVLRSLVFAGWVLASVSVFAQLPGDIALPTDTPPPRRKRPPLPNQLPENPSLAAACTVAVGTLGFTLPSSIYLGRHESLVSLDFLDESHLLFSFREPGLLRRNPAEDEEGLERRMRAVVLALPDGNVEVQSSWTIPDRARYVWMLPDGHFLLKDRDGLEVGDASLKLQTVFHFPIRPQTLALDPGQKVIVASSLQSSDSNQPGNEAAASGPARTVVAANMQDPAGGEDLTLSVIDRESLQSMHTLRVRAPFDAPINAEGYADSQPGKKYEWIIRFHSFAGGSRLLQRVRSGCPPDLGFISNRVLLVTSCTPDAMLNVAALSSLDGKKIWEFTALPEVVWPLLDPAPNSNRFARVSMILKPGVKVKDRPRFADSVQGQLVRVFDVGDDKPVFEAPLVPPLDGGGNLAFSPSGRRIALLEGSSIQVFDLPAPAQ